MRKFILTISILVIAIVIKAQNVGVNTPSPSTTLDVNGALALRVNSLTLTNAENNNISLSQHSFFRITGPTAAFAITGLTGGTDGRLVTLFNATNFPLTVRNENSGSLAANRINTLKGADMVFAPGKSSITLQYNATDAQWVLIGKQGIDPPPTLNQSAVSVYGTAGLIVTPSTPLTLVPGLTQTIAVPEASVVFITSTGGISTGATTATGFSVCDLTIVVDGSILSNAGYQRVYAANTGGVTSGMMAYWNLSAAIPLSAGSHTIAVNALGAGTGVNATVSGNNSSVLQATLTVMILKM